MAYKMLLLFCVCITKNYSNMLRGKEEQISFSRGLSGECKRSRISFKEKAFADLIAMGWKDKDAYLISGLYNPVYSSKVNEKEMNKLLMEEERFMTYLTSISRKIQRMQKAVEKEADFPVDKVSDEDIASELSKENQLRKLIAARKKYDGKEGCKEWIDLTKMIADITQIKKDEIKEEDNTVHFYLPLSCNNCSLYLAAKKKAGK